MASFYHLPYTIRTSMDTQYLRGGTIILSHHQLDAYGLRVYLGLYLQGLFEVVNGIRCSRDTVFLAKILSYRQHKLPCQRCYLPLLRPYFRGHYQRVFGPVSYTTRTSMDTQYLRGGAIILSHHQLDAYLLQVVFGVLETGPMWISFNHLRGLYSYEYHRIDSINYPDQGAIWGPIQGLFQPYLWRVFRPV